MRLLLAIDGLALAVLLGTQLLLLAHYLLWDEVHFLNDSYGERWVEAALMAGALYWSPMLLRHMTRKPEGAKP